jgi:hypothetical protein
MQEQPGKLLRRCGQRFELIESRALPRCVARA